MKIKYAFLSFTNYLSINLLIILEIYVLFTAVNISLGSLNSRSVLYTPLKEYIESDGFVFFGDSESYYDELMAEGEDGEEITEEEEEEESFGYDMDELMSTLNDSAEYTTVRSYGDSEIFYTILPDEIFDKLKLQVQTGSLFDSSEKSDYLLLIASANKDGIEKGSIVEDGNQNKYEVAAVLTDLSYLLTLSTYNYEMTYEDFYTTLDIDYDDNVFYYTSESQIKDLELLYSIDTSEIGFVTYSAQVTEEEIEADMDKLSAYGMTMKNELIESRSSSLIIDDFKKMIPPIAAFAMIVLIGIISTSAIISKNMTRKLAVMFCCGATKSDCVFVSSSSTILVTIIALAASALTVLALDGSDISKTYGLVFTNSNLLMTLILVLVLILISIVVSKSLVSTDKLHELLKADAK